MISFRTTGTASFDVFVRDRIFGFNHLISKSLTGGSADQQSLYPAISADGYHVAFSLGGLRSGGRPDQSNSRSSTSVTGMTATLERVSVSSSGEEANGNCEWPAISEDGRFVVFQSEATNLADGATGVRTIYFRDRQSGTTQCRLSQERRNLPRRPSYQPLSLPTGATWSSLLGRSSPREDASPSKDIYLLDREAGTLEVVSVANGAGGPANGDSGGPRPVVSPDGRFVAFASAAGNLVDNDTNGHWDVFVRDRQAGTTERVSVSSTGEEGNDDSGGDSYTLGMS